VHCGAPLSEIAGTSPAMTIALLIGGSVAI
jgi:hypothetical protein